MTENEIKQQFYNSLKRGTGEAYIIFSNNPKIDFSKLIIKGAITNFAYDGQCEGTRAKYIYQFIKKAKNRDKIIKAVLEKLKVEKSDYYGLEQMCDLAILFFREGHVLAKSALYERFAKNYQEGYEFCGQDQLIEIDGWNGLVKVAEKIGENLLKDDDDWASSWQVDNFQKKNKNIAVYYELEKISKENKYIAAYLKSILKYKKDGSKKSKKNIFSYATIKKEINEYNLRYISAYKANQLSIFEIEKLANDFLIEKDKRKQEYYLRFFHFRKFPFDYKPILKIALGKTSKKNRLVYFACEALKHFSSREIRELAISKIINSKNPSDYLKLLVSNYQSGDYKILVETANRSDNYEYIHNIVFGFIDIYRANTTEECKEPLEIIYNKMNCGLHREDIVNLLAENGVLSDKIFKELQFDSLDELRKLYKKKKRQLKE